MHLPLYIYVIVLFLVCPLASPVLFWLVALSLFQMRCGGGRQLVATKVRIRASFVYISRTANPGHGVSDSHTEHARRSNASLATVGDTLRWETSSITAPRTNLITRSCTLSILRTQLALPENNNPIYAI